MFQIGTKYNQNLLQNTPANDQLQQILNERMKVMTKNNTRQKKNWQRKKCTRKIYYRQRLQKRDKIKQSKFKIQYIHGSLCTEIIIMAFH